MSFSLTSSSSSVPAIQPLCSPSSSSSSSSSLIRRSNHLISISHPHHPHYLVCILHLKDSLFVWLAEAPMGAFEEAAQMAFSSNQEHINPASGGHEQPEAEDADSESEALLARVKESLSEEDRRQLEIDRQMEEELSRALEQAGRDMGHGRMLQGEAAGELARQPKGFLAREWAVAMQRQGMPPISTSLYRTPSDLALPISRRLAKRLAIPQIHLSISLPEDLQPQGNMPAPPGANEAIMDIERGLEEAIRDGMSSPHAEAE